MIARALRYAGYCLAAAAAHSCSTPPSYWRATLTNDTDSIAMSAVGVMSGFSRPPRSCTMSCTCTRGIGHAAPLIGSLVSPCTSHDAPASAEDEHSPICARSAIIRPAISVGESPAMTAGSTPAGRLGAGVAAGCVAATFCLPRERADGASIHCNGMRQCGGRLLSVR